MRILYLTYSLGLLFLLLVGEAFSEDAESTCDASVGECSGLILSEETRERLATKLNNIIDVPILSEDHEQVLAEKIIEMCVLAFGDDEEDFQEMKREIKGKFVQKLNQAIDVPFANEELEARVLGKIVDFILKDTFSQDADKDDDDEEASEEVTDE